MNKKKSLGFLGIQVLFVALGVLLVCSYLTKDVGIIFLVGFSFWITMLLAKMAFTDNSFATIGMTIVALGALLLAIAFMDPPGVLVDLGFWTLYVFGLAFRKVKKDTFVILGNKMFLPGQWYYLWPFLAYNLEIFTKEKDLGVSRGKISTKDGDFVAKIRAKIVFDIPIDPEEWKDRLVFTDRFAEMTLCQIKSITNVFASGKALSEIIGKKTSAPLRFDPLTGTIEIEFLGLSVVKP